MCAYGSLGYSCGHVYDLESYVFYRSGRCPRNCRIGGTKWFQYLCNSCNQPQQ